MKIIKIFTSSGKSIILEKANVSVIEKQVFEEGHSYKYTIKVNGFTFTDPKGNFASRIIRRAAMRYLGLNE